MFWNLQRCDTLNGCSRDEYNFSIFRRERESRDVKRGDEFNLIFK